MDPPTQFNFPKLQLAVKCGGECNATFIEELNKTKKPQRKRMLKDSGVISWAKISLL
jgi:hypothetical protein